MKKMNNKQAKRASKLAKAENLRKKEQELINKIVTVKNAEGDPDTVAEIVVQNQINYTPKVSVIIPVYNVEPYLRECLDSVVNQTLQEIEIICVDDGSTDKSLDILLEYAKKDKRITVMKQENLHAGVARNAGLAVAKGEYVHFLDSDDMYPNKKTLEHMYTAAIKNNVLICGGSLNQLCEGTLIADSSKFEEGYTFQRNYLVNYEDYQFDYGYWRFIYNRQFLKENQLYFPDYLRQQDPPFFVKTMAVAQTFYALTEPTYVYRVSHKQMSWNERKATDVAKALTDILTYTKTYNLDKLHFKIAKRITTPWFLRAFELLKPRGEKYLIKLINLLNYNVIYENDAKFALPWFYKSIQDACRVSIVIPVYNVETYLRQCLDSVIQQTYKNIEIICVNDGSTDNSLNILEEYAKKDNRIKIINRKNGGLSAARNTGMDYCNSEFVYFLDSDDYIEKNTIEILYNKLVNDNSDVSYGGVKCFGDKLLAASKQNFFNRYNKNGKYDIALDIRSNVVPVAWNKIYKMSIIKEFNIRFPEGLINEDEYWLWAYMIHCKTYSVTDKQLYFYLQRSDSIMGKRNNDIKILHIMDIHCLIYETVKKYKNIKLYENILIDFFLRHARDLYKRCPLELYDSFCNKVSKYYNECGKSPAVKQYIEFINKKISIIVPVYNAEKYLKECLNSLIHQTLRNIEIICINDASTDASLQIIEEYAKKDGRIIVVNNKENIGAPGAVKNIGLKYAKGEYIGFIDSDDYVDLNYFEVLFEEAIKNNADIAATKSIVKFSKTINNKILLNCPLNILTDIKQKQELMEKSGSNCNKIYKKSLLDNYHITCYNKKNIAEDNYFSMLSMILANKIVLTDKVSYYYRKHENSITSEKRGINDFLIFDVYELIENKILKIFGKTASKKYLNAVRFRELQDFIWFKNDCKEEYLDQYKNKLKEKFPFLYYKVFRNEIIISLTSYPARIGTVNQTIESLLKQSMKADKVILWLAPEQFPHKEKDLPQQLLNLREKGLSIEWYHDIRSYKKLIPTLKKYPDSIVVTADDDNIYQYQWLEKLYNSYMKYPQDIQAHRVTKFYYNQMFQTIAGGWDYYKGASYLNKLVGLGGVLYPPHCFYKDILNEDLIMQLAPTNDDQWFWLQAVLNGVKVRVVKNPDIEAHYVPGTQETGLTNINDHGKKLFWKDFNRIINYYPQLHDILFKEALKYKVDAQIKVPYKKEIEQWWFRIKRTPLNLDNPQTFNEKIQWLKLYDSTPIKTRLADKYLVRNWVKEKIGEEYLIPLLGVYDRFEDIDFAKLPNRFVIKCNHGSGWNIIVKDKSELNITEAKSKIDKWMSENFAFYAGCELQYRDIEPKIIIEKYMDDGTGDLRDYKFTCFNGKPEFIWIDSDRHTEHKRNLYDLNWKQLPYKVNPRYSTFPSPNKPECFDEMTRLSKILSKGFPYVRVDFYIINGKIYFGEMTFTSSSGTEEIVPSSFDRHLSSLIKLPKLAYNIDTGQYYKLPKPSKLKPFLLFPYYLLQLPKLRKERFNMQVKQLSTLLTTARIDVKNHGTADNNLNITASDALIEKPTWFNNATGCGSVITASALLQYIRIQAIKNGLLKINFQGLDKRHNGKRFPLWIDYKSIKINGKEILTAPVATWHDKPFTYEMPVKDGQMVNLEITQQPHNYTADELKNVILKLSPNDEYVKNHADELVKEILQNNKILQKRIEQNTIPKKVISYKLFNFVPVFSVKQRGGRKVWSLLGIPLWKKRITDNGENTKYYLLGLPLMRVHKESYQLMPAQKALP